MHKPLFISAFILLFCGYIASYFWCVKVVDYSVEHIIFPQAAYRVDNQIVRVLYKPMVSLDRIIRRDRWGAREELPNGEYRRLPEFDNLFE